MRYDTRKGLWSGTLVAAVLALALALGACSARAVDGGTWTVALYLCGSNLESRQGWATKTLEEISGAKMPANVKVVAQAGGADEWESDAVVASGTRLEVRGGKLEEVGQAGEEPMGRSATLAGFLKFVEQEYPADHTAVVLWDHGGGPLKGACFDEVDGFDALTLPELDEAFAAGVKARGGRPYDLVGFDACLMASLEIAVSLEDDASWLVASEELEAGAGWSYPELLAALGRGADAREAGITICDAYQAKSAKRKKDATATLSVVDLSKVGAVEDALDALAKALFNAYGPTSTVRRLLYGVRLAESFGGASDQEGHTNLTDLLGMTQGMLPRPQYQSELEALAQAVRDAVAYAVNGAATTGANGLSLWCPMPSSPEEVAEYASMTPLEEYAWELKAFFSEELEPVKFLDDVKVGTDGGVTMTVDPACADAFYDLYVENRRSDGTYYDTNVDIVDDWEKLSFTYNPSLAVAITLDGMVLDANVVGYGEGHETFSSPVEVDGHKTNLRTMWVENDQEEGGGHYELLGIWDGIDDLNGLADRSMDDLRAGSTVAAVSLESDEERDRVQVGAQPKVSEAPLAPGSYEFRFVGIDLMGKEYPSQKVVYEVAEDGSTKIISVGGTPVA